MTQFFNFPFSSHAFCPKVGPEDSGNGTIDTKSMRVSHKPMQMQNRCVWKTHTQAPLHSQAVSQRLRKPSAPHSVNVQGSEPFCSFSSIYNLLEVLKIHDWWISLLCGSWSICVPSGSTATSNSTSRSILCHCILVS